MSSRTRNYATVVYPESAPIDWFSILADNKVPCFVSPLHDKDVNPSGGEPKKSHYHVMIMFDNVKTQEQAEAIFSLIGGVGCEIVQSPRGYARYLCHLDNPEKAQYNVEDVKQFGGADFLSVIGLATDKYKAIAEMKDWCEENDIYFYCDLFEYASTERYDWFRILCDCGSYVMGTYLKSKKYKKDVT